MTDGKAAALVATAVLLGAPSQSSTHASPPVSTPATDTAATTVSAGGSGLAGSGRQGGAGFEPCSAGGVLRADIKPDLYCFALFPTEAFRAVSGRVEMGRMSSPFGVAVTAEGVHRFRLTLWVEGLPATDPRRGPQGTAPRAGAVATPAFIAWATTPLLDPAIKLGEVRNGRNDLGEVAFNKFLVLVTREASAGVAERSGPLVLRGRSPANLMEAHDLLTIAPSAIFPGAPGAAESATGNPRAGGDARTAGDPDSDPARAGADAVSRVGEHAAHTTSGDDGSSWSMPPMHPANPMLPGMSALRPGVRPLLPGVGDPGELPEARPSRLVRLGDGGTLDLEARLVRRTIKGRTLVMFGFNGQYPGPLVHVPEGATIFVNFTNHTGLPTAIHWHGVRLDNRFDGVPGVTQEPVLPGGSFRYQVFFRDAGIYWYHPHHREDVQQELGLYGNLLVESPRPDYYSPVSREAALMVDDLLLGEEGLVPFGAESSNYMLMGRFGNVFLVNGEPEYRLDVKRGEVVRFFFTNVSNTRTFNLSFRKSMGRPDSPASGAGGPRSGPRGGENEPGEPGTDTRGLAGTPGEMMSGAGARHGPAPRPYSLLPMKVVGSDVGKFEREEWADSLVISPAERYIVEVRFPEAGTWELTNHVQAIHHLHGRFFDEVDVLGSVEVAATAAEADHSAAFERLRVNADVVADIDRYRDQLDRAPDLELVLTLETRDLPAPVEQLMQFDSLYFNPVEWSGTMPMMNWVSASDTVSWVLREPATGDENMDIDWRFAVGDLVKVRLVNDRDAFHAMQHPFHIHGQRFLVVEQNGVPTENLVWKDTVLLPVGSTTDILLELSNPGRWMAHCHIAEHLESGMKLVFEVEGEAPPEGPAGVERAHEHR